MSATDCVIEATARSVPTLRFDASQLRHLEALATAGYPEEVCGLLIGHEANGEVLVSRAVQANNLATDRRRDRYLLDPDDFVAADDQARRDGLQIVGIWHTHPDHPARPSPTDIARAWVGYVYLILSVGAEGLIARRSWLLNGSSTIEQRIEESAP